MSTEPTAQLKRELNRTEPPDVWPDVEERGPLSAIESGPSWLRRVGVLVLALALAIGSFLFVARVFRTMAVPEPAQTPSPTVSVGPAGNGLIAFGCEGRICTMAPDGSGVIDLIEGYDRSVVVAGYWPAWSPDGTRIAFSGYDHEGSFSGGGANYDVYVMNVDGSDLRNLTKSPDDVARGASQGLPVWSPDGTMLAFDGDDGKTEGLYVIHADGTGFFLRIADGGAPDWSPDGTSIVFTIGVSHGSDVYAVAPDGTGVAQLTDSPGWDQQPSWSPDGTRIAFDRTDGEVNSVFVMAADGSEEREVFQEKGVYPIQPLWSPDGTQLLFEAYTKTAEGNYDLYIVNADGSGSTHLTPTTDRAENDPVWSPDGTMIAFRATTQLNIPTDDYQVFLIHRDGTHEERLTTNQSGYSLAWQSAG